MTDTTKQEKLADKIAKLLRKAENTDVQAEADTFIAKAQQLQEEYAISELMVARARGENEQEREEVVRELFNFSGRYRLGERAIATVIAKACRCRVIGTYYRWQPGEPKKGESIWVVGFKSDVDRVRLLNSSLQIQAHAAMMRWWKAERLDYMRGSQGFLARRQFMLSFSGGLEEQLSAANKAAKEEAEKREEEAGRESTGVALAIVEGEQLRDQWIDTTFGRLTTGRRRQYRGGGLSAITAGSSAGRSADASSGRGVKGGGGRALTA